MGKRVRVSKRDCAKFSKSEFANIREPSMATYRQKQKVSILSGLKAMKAPAVPQLLEL